MKQEDDYWHYLSEGLELFVSNEGEFWDKWMNDFEIVKESRWSVEHLPKMLAMLPLPYRARMNIKEGYWRTKGLKCRYDLISGGVKCRIYPSDALNNTRMNSDHRWPASLGGIEDITNQMDLCRHHNMAKNNDIRGYEWSPEKSPDWIENVLEQMWENVKRYPERYHLA